MNSAEPISVDITPNDTWIVSCRGQTGIGPTFWTAISALLGAVEEATGEVIAQPESAIGMVMTGRAWTEYESGEFDEAAADAQA